MNGLKVVAMVVVGLLAGALVKRYAAAPSPSSSSPLSPAKANLDLGQTPANLPPSYIREDELPAGTFTGLSPQQVFTALKVANEKSCTCGCPNDSVAKCRTHDPDCTTAPRLLAEIIADAKAGLSSADILAKMGEGATAVPDVKTVYAVPVGESPARGPAHAKVTLVELADFQCPYCQQMEPILAQLRAEYPKDLRLVFKENPLPFHNRATLAAEAALAAGDQGKFWEMHDRLLRAPVRLERDDLLRDAAELKLDLPRFQTALDRGAHHTIIDAERQEAVQLGAEATPTFFINGHRLVGLQTHATLAALIDEQKAVAERALAQGLPADDLYVELLKQEHAQIPAAPPPRSLSRLARQVTVPDGAPSLGSEDAPVTLMEWGDFQCPFTARAEATVKALRATYGDKLRIVWRNQPLPNHPAASPAALAALAAGAQGKFWEVHDTLLTHADGLRPEDIEGLVTAAGVDVPRWQKDLADPATARRLAADIRAGHAAGAVSTPAFFINGLEVDGAQPLATFTALIDEQLQRATQVTLREGTGGSVSEQLTAQNAGASPVLDEPELSAFSDAPANVDVGDAPTIGPANAPVTIVEMSDFECAFCASAAATLAAVEDRYAGRVRVAFKQAPLAFHKHAELAAEAALAAGEQGKFWPMEEALFRHVTTMDRAAIDADAKAVGLDLGRFKAALDGGQLKARVVADAQQAQALGVTATPTFFVNGHRVVGAVPFDTWAHLIDAELARTPGGADAGEVGRGN